MTEDLLPAVLPSIIQGLQDVDDDVRAVAAAALLPITHMLIKTCPQQVRPNVSVITISMLMQCYSSEFVKICPISSVR